MPGGNRHHLGLGSGARLELRDAASQLKPVLYILFKLEQNQ